ncbi:Glutamine-dependent carbamoyl-phosphate synthase [Gracilaria domingensis]|nr:Glutamine-dependent carbamoyl-phosphate synthase [Gracilaria domingensis]
MVFARTGYRGLKEARPGYGSDWWAGWHKFFVSKFSKNEWHRDYELLRGTFMASLFYEPLKRTSCSFQAAMQRLGGRVLSIQDVGGSSVAKVESLRDTMRILFRYYDIIVLRHPAVGATQQAAYHSKEPAANASNRIGKNPTHALLDIFTIREELGTVNNATITFVGHLRNGSTVQSLARVLALYSVPLCIYPRNCCECLMIYWKTCLRDI